ncbi:permease-like cell division protein FtsX [Actinospica sp.]|jgi:cell division transport system permease protein|uniref:permease-like cell division protein FtsX n=1 Tax=Actinospica sp. TaxID=1872142 RepID=UPI002B73D1FC|nr:permease-like cell division protein FtsX [Actinospica sp.]HWG27882.1 permease-like cell division protein FtsX [Actinospica sp.]
MRIQYVLQEIGHGLRRNLTMVIAVVVSTAVALTMLGAGLLMWQQTKAMEGYWYGKVQVAVYMCNQNDVGNAPNCSSQVTGAESAAIKAKLQSTPYVQQVILESQNEAYQHYEQEYGKTALGQNATPSFLESDFRVKLSDPSKYQIVEGAVGGMPGVASVVDEQQLLQPLFTFIHIAEYTAVGVASVMLVLAFLLIFNTVRLSAFSRRRETGIMRLVGASNFYIQMPFLLEGAVAGLFGGVLASGVLIGIKAFFIDGIVAPHLTSIQFIGWGPFVFIVPVLLGAGVLMAVIASAFTLRKYLRV